jgi:hypothetical protein
MKLSQNRETRGGGSRKTVLLKKHLQNCYVILQVCLYGLVLHGCRRIIAGAIMRLRNCQRQFRRLVLSCHAQGIVAESPQDLHKQIRGLAAESPVFCGVSRKKCARRRSLSDRKFIVAGAHAPPECAKILNRSKITNEFLERLL